MTQTSLTDQASLQLWYGAAEHQLTDTALDLLSKKVPDFDALSAEDRCELLRYAKQDLAVQMVPLGTFLSYLDMKSEEAARASVDGVASGLSEAELGAVVKEQQLRVLQATGLEVDLVTGGVLAEIGATGAYAVHPNGYRGIHEMAEAAGISASERSDLMALSQTIFPWIENTLGQDPRAIWQRVGKAKFRRIVPLLRSLIEPAYDGTDRVRQQINKVREERGATDDKGLVGDILDMAEEHSVRNLDLALRPGDREPFILYATQRNGRVMITGTITEDDLELMQRKLHQFATVYIKREPIDIRGDAK